MNNVIGKLNLNCNRSGRRPIVEEKNAMTNENCDFEEWHAFLCQYAASKGGSADDADSWAQDYEDGKTPEEAWRDEWGD